ncbi:MAG TPA: SDR family oxidoreductase [Iamia sp.]|jgi:NAD(P)-dependent dehydrogenase (short-subunit alcohol dehydrogenase family)|nr:SDR family oxidoreductase [Iamia sp.]
MRVVVIGASSGLGRCIAAGLGQQGARVALMGRRRDRLEGAAAEAGDGAVVVPCDVTDPASCRSAISDAAAALGGIDGLVYTAGVGPLARLVDTDAEAWRLVLDTNVTGASLVTAAAVPHLTASSGTAIYLSSVSASQTPPWPGLGAYAVSKAALDKLVEAWRGEHPEVGFTRLTVGECGGGPGDSMSGFASGWDHRLAGELVTTWIQRGYMTGALMDVSQLVAVVDRILRSDPSVCMPTVMVAPRLVVPDTLPTEESFAAGQTPPSPVVSALPARPEREVP